MPPAVKPFLRTLLPGRRTLAVTLLAHLFAVLALAAVPRWHERLHGDAGLEDHDCAVVLFAHGGADQTTGPVPTPGFVVERVGFVPLAMAAGDFVPSTFATAAVFEHGPPVVG